MSDTNHIHEVVSDILRANATKVFAAKCATCGQKQEQTLSWLQSRRFICPFCGGKLDDSLLHQLTLSAMRKLQVAAKPSKKRAVQPIEPVTDTPIDAAQSYQLVLQFHGDSLQDLRELVALEDELTAELGDSADVDGHDIGSGETNIFILTSDPAGTFRSAKPVLERKQSLSLVTAAYRPVDGERFTVIWPVGSRKKFVVA